ncbi:hypothetical protein VNI00_016374 [Paramarasmius palmivorus]|uniref:Uncharacterized protein n=1 Tax=Paramarasmius palmivorus TaxID=297713 RepID=A0AAW0BEV1_9AGAR
MSHQPPSDQISNLPRKYSSYDLDSTPDELCKVDLQTLMDMTNAANNSRNSSVSRLCHTVLRKRALENPAEALRIFPLLYDLNTYDLDDIVRPTARLGVDYAIRVMGNRTQLLFTWILYKEQADRLETTLDLMPSGLPPAVKTAAEFFRDQRLGAHKDNLAKFCTGFPLIDSVTHDIQDIVQLTENEEILKLLLRYTHFNHHDQKLLLSTKLQTLIDFAAAADKYGNWLAGEECQAVLKKRASERADEALDLLKLLKTPSGSHLEHILKPAIPSCIVPHGSPPCTLAIDVLFQSSDGKLLGAHKDNIAQSCKNLLRPNSAPRTFPCVVQTDHLKEILELLLQYTHLDYHDRINLNTLNLQTLIDLTVAADKYDHQVAFKKCKAQIKKNNSRPAEALQILSCLHLLTDPPNLDEIARTTLKLRVDQVLQIMGHKPDFVYAWALYKSQHTKSIEKLKSVVDSIPDELPAARYAASYFRDEIIRLQHHTTDVIRAIRHATSSRCAFNVVLDEYMDKVVDVAKGMELLTWRQVLQRVQTLLRELESNEPLSLSSFQGLVNA